jgi:Glutamine synthetase
MQTHDVTTAEDARQIINERGLDYVKVGLFDIDGVLRGKYMAKDKFLSALEHGFGFCDVVLGWDSQDQLYDNVAFTGWHTGYGDAPVRIIPESCRELPLEQNALLFLAEFSGEAAAICPRGILQSMNKKSRGDGFNSLCLV